MEVYNLPAAVNVRLEEKANYRGDFRMNKIDRESKMKTQ